MTPKRYFLFSHNQLLMQTDSDITPPAFQLLPESLSQKTPLFIGNFNGHDCYTLQIENSITFSSTAWLPMKKAMELCDKSWFGVIARAHQILQWDNNHRYCGKCGGTTHRLEHHFERKCDACHLSFFPKISPAIIVRITKDNKILMARSKHFPEGVYALIAGFVEPGETFEEAIHRETYEEIGISVNNITYAGSQAWPFPDSLMVAFTAEYVAGEIRYIDGEIEHADWYDKNNIPGFPSTSMSIAQVLIDDFIRS